jgi:ferrous iron transport protein B
VGEGPHSAAAATGGGPRDVLILGNLQSGKTTIFRRLCGERTQEIGLCGSSRRLTRGELPPPGMRFWPRLTWGLGRRGPRRMGLIDTPGTTTLFAQDEDEMLASEALFGASPGALLIVADAKNLRRSLALLAHAAEFGRPTVLAINMLDEAHASGIEFDIGLMESRLGIAVVPTVATLGTGLDRVAAELARARVPGRLARFPQRIEGRLSRLEAILAGMASPRALALSLAAGDPRVGRRVEAALGAAALAEAMAVVREIERESELPVDVVLSEAFHSAGARFAARTSSHGEAGPRHLRAFGRLAHHPVYGLAIAAAVVAAMYLWVGALGATLVVDTLDERLFRGWLLPLARQGADALPWPLLAEALMDPDFGLVTNGLVLAFGLVLPVLFFFYFGFQFLLESGYLPRLSVLLDRVFRRLGLNGRGILPLTLGLSCVTMALITTRMLKTDKERNIASLLLLLGTPCAPLLSVMLLVLAELPVTASIAVFGIILTQTVLVGALVNRLLPGTVSDFILELPPMRVPRPRHVLLQTGRQTFHFMKEALPLFLLASLVMFAASRAGWLAALEDGARPLMGGLLGLPDRSVQVFIKTMIRRESGAAELEATRAAFDHVQIVVTLLVMTFLTPCVNASLVLIKERGLCRALAMLLGVSLWALLVGAAVNAVCRGLGVTFT